MQTKDTTLGQYIRGSRTMLGLTQVQLADRAGVRQSDISRIERDQIELPRRDRLEALAGALDVTLGDLLIATGWLEEEHAATIAATQEGKLPDPDILDDAMAVLKAAKERVAETAALLVRAEGHVSAVIDAQKTWERAHPETTNETA